MLHSYFNPRSRVGNDISSQNDTPYFTDFNPRSRVGNDGMYGLNGVYFIISIHVPAWGTTKLQVMI